MKKNELTNEEIVEILKKSIESVKRCLSYRLIIKNRWGVRSYGTINRIKNKLVASGLKLAQHPTVFYNVLCTVLLWKLMY